MKTSLIISVMVLILICFLFIFCCATYNCNNSYQINNFVTSPSLSLGSNVEIKTIQIDNQIRKYLKINFNQYNILDENILLGFPGGGEDMVTFLEYTKFNQITSRVIIFEGQPSGNKYSFQNAFPWMFTNVQNDIKFADIIVSNIIRDDVQHNRHTKLFLTGKSDGAGFTVLYANASFYKNYIKAIGMCSASHFGINNINNIQHYNRQVYMNNGIIIPYNIILPPNISIFVMHGTSDQVMPYNGQNYNNSLALKLSAQKKTIWANIDNTLKSTYTPDIKSYVNKIINNKITQIYSTKTYSCQTAVKHNSYVNFITIFNQNHCWSGHTNSGPDSNEASNMYLDATYLLSLFFKLDIENYKPTINTIPHGLYKYDGEQLLN